MPLAELSAYVLNRYQNLNLAVLRRTCSLTLPGAQPGTPFGLATKDRQIALLGLPRPLR